MSDLLPLDDFCKNPLRLLEGSMLYKKIFFFRMNMCSIFPYLNVADLIWFLASIWFSSIIIAISTVTFQKHSMFLNYTLYLIWSQGGLWHNTQNTQFSINRSILIQRDQKGFYYKILLIIHLWRKMRFLYQSVGNDLYFQWTSYPSKI